MKRFFLLITFLLSLSLAPGASAARAADAGAQETVRTVVRQTTTIRQAAATTQTAAPDVTVSLCLESGNVLVHGWGRNEVRARTEQAARLDLRAPGGVGKGQAAARLEVLVSNDPEDERDWGECGGSGNVELDVPRGASVQLQMHSGEVVMTDVAEARVESLSGNVDLQRVSRQVNVSNMSGDITLRDATGLVRLRTVSGDIEAGNVRPLSAKDDFAASSASGSITLDEVTHPQVKGITINGNVEMTGALARGGSYDFRTTSGDVTLNLPADSSFKVTARVILGGEIITDFPLKTGPGAVLVKEQSQSRLTGTVGGGNAEVNLSSFNGTVHLKKQ